MTQTPDFLAVVEIEAVKQPFVLFCGVGSGTQVKNKLNLIFIFLEPVWKFRPVYPLHTCAGFVVSQLVWPRFEVVHEHQIVEAFRVEASRQCTSNEPSGPRNGNHVAKVLSQPAP